MLAYVIGNVDINSAAALCIISICLCIIITTMIAKRRSRLALSQDFELAKMKQHDEQQATMAKIALDRDYKFKQLDQNLITSHKVEG